MVFAIPFWSFMVGFQPMVLFAFFTSRDERESSPSRRGARLGFFLNFVVFAIISKISLSCISFPHPRFIVILLPFVRARTFARTMSSTYT